MRILGSLKTASKFMLNVDFDREKWEYNFTKISLYKIARTRALDEIVPSLQNIRREGYFQTPFPPRLNLLRMSMQPEDAANRISCYEPGIEFDLTLKKRQKVNVSELEERVALEALCLSQIFGGVGAVTRRGFGATCISEIENCNYKDIKESVKEIYVSQGEKALRNFIDKSMDDARKLLQKETRIPQEIPDFPVLSSQNRIFKLALREIRLRTSYEVDKILQYMGYKNTEAMRLLAWLGYSTMKITWKVSNNKAPTDPDYSFHTWILGLPREVKGTGYKPVGEYTRRASSISLRPIRRIGEGLWQVVVYGFVSKDWPEINHFSHPNSPRSVSISVENAFNQAWNMINKILGGP